MGWYFGHKTRAALVAELREVAPGCRLLDTHEGQRGAFWLLIECGPEQTARGLPLVLIACDLIESRGGSWGYKPMDESMGPYYFDCPLTWLDRAPVLNADWRTSVRGWHEAQRAERLNVLAGIYGAEDCYSDADPGL